ncbi:3527_t:CDS:1, partial [Paraglomus occultum]
PGAVRDLVGVLDKRTPGTVAILVTNLGFSEGVETEIKDHPHDMRLYYLI